MTGEYFSQILEKKSSQKNASKKSVRNTNVELWARSKRGEGRYIEKENEL